ncbi:MAG TPA: hypothetical protein VHW60_01900 [Caulobacteraceae bacterium]|jgi:hypothetical protein|nr:hypothetical protein [Caulobacteraceae bacterium]
MSVVAFKFDDAQPLAEKMRKLRDEAAGYARDHSYAFATALAELESFAEDIATGGESYPVGIRETARQLATELLGARRNVSSILEARRTGRTGLARVND